MSDQPNLPLWKLQPWLAMGVVYPDRVLDPVGAARANIGSPKPPLTQELIDTYRRKLKIALFATLAVFALVFAYIWLFVSLRWDFSSFCASNFENWFAPSGAVVVFAALFVEWRVKELFEYQQTMAEGPVILQPSIRARKVRNIIDRIALGSILLGTIIWAYGDKIILWANNCKLV